MLLNQKLIDKLEKARELLDSNHNVPSHLLKQLETSLDSLLESSNTILVESFSTDQPIIIWSDGACAGNPGPGGWGTIVEIDGNRFEYSGGNSNTTNNIMELTGALEGLKRTPDGSHVTVISDSQYLVKGMTEWLNGWKKKGWKKADGKNVLNRDLWEKLDAESARRTIHWQWIKGHAGHPENERCDELARSAIRL